VTPGHGGVLEDLLIDHNTAIPGGYSTYYVQPGTPPGINRFRLTNNLMGFGSYGVGFPKADAGLAKWSLITRNALVSMADIGDGQGAARNRPSDIDQTMYTSFPNAAAAGLNADGTLTEKSPNRRAGSDGKDIGVDFDELLRAYTGQPSRK
jgi:hypothetical protein